MNRPFSSGRTKLHGFGRIYPVPIPLDPAVHAGATVVGRDPDDNRLKLYLSDGTEWTRSIFDTTITETIERLINDIFLNGFDEADLPDPTLAENLRRYAFNNTRGLPGFVYNDQWNYLADEARVAEIAQAIAASTFRVLTADIDLVVGPGTEIEGQRYNTLGGALQFCSQFYPNFAEGEDATPRITVTIEAGVSLSEQIELVSVNLGHVSIMSEDALVPVNAAALTKLNDPALQAHSFIQASRSILPVIDQVQFERFGTPPQDAAAISSGVVPGSYTPKAYGINATNGSNLAIAGDRVAKLRWAGFTSFDTNLRAGPFTVAALSYTNLDDGGDHGLFAQGGATMFVRSTVARGCGINGLLNIASEVRFDGVDGGAGASVGGAFGNDFRNTAGVDGAADFVISAGASTILPDEFRGGSNVPRNILSANGLIVQGGGGVHYTRANIVGALGQSGGVPTGAIIQRGIVPGSGQFTRFADGTQICRFSLSLNPAADSIWTYPAAFFDASIHVIGTFNDGSLTSGAIHVFDITASSIKVNAVSAASARLAGFVYLVAVGRWF